MPSARHWSDTAEIFRHHRAAPIRSWERWILGVLLFLGLWSVGYFALWWFQLRHVHGLVLFALLSLATWYGVFRMMVGWYNAFHLEQPDFVAAPEGLSVAIFTTSSPGEPYDMFVRTLAAAREVRYPHTTYLLDDTRDPRFALLAEEMGAVPLELIGIPGAKAGKINEALKRTKEEFILVLDPDHIPFPEFLDRVLGYFADPEVGFVQVAQAYYNPPESFVARAAAEQTFAFYGPIMQGMHGTGTSVAIGANCTFRRAALESVGGHGIGLAEDLVTSIRLHAEGWKSVYVPEIVSRGLVPSDLGSFLKQQLKWSRGVHEVLFKEYPRAFLKLSAHQRISYFMIGSYYIVGLTTLIYTSIPLIYLWTGRQPAAFLLSEYILHALPVGVFGVIIYRFTQRWLCDPLRERGFHWRGTLLKIGSWSVYLKGLALSILNVAVPYIPTAKERQRNRFWTMARVPVLTIVIAAITVLWTLWRELYVLPEPEVRITTEVVFGMLFFLAMNALMMSGRVYAAWIDREREDEE
ncbi:MAG TPA: glycosyltransferase family 2 protein [Thermoanaerobaculia bacterium]|nr:glycosyltransferase family 2 protein [Thermoanaerobaculia bacterium]